MVGGVTLAGGGGVVGSLVCMYTHLEQLVN